MNRIFQKWTKIKMQVYSFIILKALSCILHGPLIRQVKLGAWFVNRHRKPTSKSLWAIAKKEKYYIGL
ncbi:unnamed protein product [Blepharisma stoltei]|uniref:Uncharacterized protein n=1 Tax=Blepharisma stoltei TaxID=1481888 RepID=A0AAU9K2W4_9CILI|nr:unnamed protein product [Blepharisma stoltei]